MLKDIYSKKITELREKNNMSVSGLADRVNADEPTVLSWENGETVPSAENFYKMAKVFSVSMDIFFESEEEKKQVEKSKEENKDLLECLKESLQEKVSDVKLSTRLKTHPVCLSADEGISFEMEKVLAQMPDGNPYGMKAVRILEINPNHAIFNALQNIYKKDKTKVNKYASLLYDQALLIEGFDLEDPIAFSNAICELMIDASK